MPGLAPGIHAFFVETSQGVDGRAKPGHDEADNLRLSESDLGWGRIMEWIPLVGGLGIGAVLKSIADYFMARRAATSDRWYQEKREAYLGLLTALHTAAVEPSDAHSKGYALWQTKCDLFGSSDVSTFAQRIVDTNDSPIEERNEAFRNLIAAMKADLQRK